MNDFAGKVVVVTGGSSGIGRAAAIMFAQRGGKVVVAARRVPQSEETVRMMKEAGGEGMFVQTDVRVAAQVENLVKRTVDTYGRLDIAFNNAGKSGIFQSLVTENEEAFYEQIDTNLKGVWLCMKYELPEMLKQGGGVIVNNSSITGLRALRKLSSYSASKHAVIGLTNAAAKEFAPYNIRIMALCPAWTMTEMTKEFTIDPERKEKTARSIPLRRIAQPEEIAELACFLASDKASFIAGGAIAISGALDI
ncbi:MAG: glucose 1-dehydrogenase [Deltaproteobacteria bacterium]|nr:glucose 1-dehydrogenase [Deltaproteobacteria bacterium]